MDKILSAISKFLLGLVVSLVIGYIAIWIFYNLGQILFDTSSMRRTSDISEDAFIVALGLGGTFSTLIIIVMCYIIGDTFVKWWEDR